MIEVAVYDTKPYDREYLSQAAGAEASAIRETWGEQIEDRGSQITFSALGQRAPLEQKEKWDADFTKRKRIKALLKDLISEFTVRLGGTTSIDVTKLGIDKAYGIKNSGRSSVWS
jgi:phosphomannomutase